MAWMMTRDPLTNKWVKVSLNYPKMSEVYPEISEEELWGKLSTGRPLSEKYAAANAPPATPAEPVSPEPERSAWQKIRDYLPRF